MRNPHIVKVLHEVIEEGKRERAAEKQYNEELEKLVLIDDIVKVKKVLFGQGELQHSEFMNDNAAGQLFDDLYDMDLPSLILLRDLYGKQATNLIKRRLQ